MAPFVLHRLAAVVARTSALLLLLQLTQAATGVDSTEHHRALTFSRAYPLLHMEAVSETEVEARLLTLAKTMQHLGAAAPANTSAYPTTFIAKLRRAQSVPLRERVSQQLPFWQFHVPKTAGSTMSYELRGALGANRPRLFPCENCACECGYMKSVENFKKFTCAEYFLGHFAPLSDVPEMLAVDAGVIGAARRVEDPRCTRYRNNLAGKLPVGVARAMADVGASIEAGLGKRGAARSMKGVMQQAALVMVRHSLCTFALRDPRTRLVSHWYAFNYKLNGGMSLPEALRKKGINRTVAETGGLVYKNVVFSGSAAAAQTMLQQCVVGVQEAYPEYVETLRRFLPGLAMPKDNKNHLQHHERVGMDDFDVEAFFRRLTPLLQPDVDLWIQGTAVAKRQHTAALRFPPLPASARNH